MSHLAPKGPPEPVAPQREIVFLPGLLNDSRLWLQQMEGLHDIAHATVADISKRESMAELAADVLQQAPPGGFVLVGLSMGGYVALEIMRQTPERVLGLALLDTSARPDTPEATMNRRKLVEQSKSDFPGVVSTLLSRLIHPARNGDVVISEAFTAMAKGLGQAAFMRQQTAIIGRIDSRPSLTHIVCPTLIMCGRQDQVTPLEVHEEMRAAIPGAQLKIIEDCAHLSPLERPLEVTQALRDWLLAIHASA